MQGITIFNDLENYLQCSAKTFLQSGFRSVGTIHSNFYLNNVHICIFEGWKEVFI